MRSANSKKAVAFVFVLVTGGNAPPSQLTAVFTQVQGNVTVAEASIPVQREVSTVRPAQVLQVVRSGDRLNLPSGARAIILCSSDRWLELTGGHELLLTEELCGKGKLLTRGIYLRLAPAAGRMRSLAGALVLERETREGDGEYFGIPLLLSPRNTKIRDSRPTILWTQVSDASSYEIELMGPNNFGPLILDANQVVCNETWGDFKVCSLPYPTKAIELPPDTVSFLAIRVRRGLAAPLREEAQPNRIQRLPSDKAETLQKELQRLGTSPLNELARQLLEADLYTREGLLADAITVYRKALSVQDIPEARITLGDTLLEVGLLHLAFKTYREALDRKPGTAVQAAAEFGLGKIEYSRGNSGQAACHFGRARKLYALLGLNEEAAMAARGEDITRRRNAGV